MTTQLSPDVIAIPAGPTLTPDRVRVCAYYEPDGRISSVDVSINDDEWSWEDVAWLLANFTQPGNAE